jgi:ABC-2 type transport system ATP-binding protein
MPAPSPAPAPSAAAPSTAPAGTTSASAAPANVVAIACRGLVKAYGEVVAVDGLDLSVRRGECFGLLGPNGAGKTTTIELLEGLQEPDAGEIEILGTTWAEDAAGLRERLAISLQETQLGEKLTVAETLRLFASFYRESRDPEEVLALVALEEKRDARVGKLSGGQKQRLAVACALVGDPEVLFLDEPTTGLDPQSRLQLWEQVTEFRRGGGTVMLTTHYMEEAERLCDRVAIIDHGKAIALGSPAELIRELHAANVIELATDPEVDRRLLAGLPGVSEVRRRGPNWSLAVGALSESVPALLAAVEQSGAKLVYLSTHEATLEDLFVALTGRALRDE